MVGGQAPLNKLRSGICAHACAIVYQSVLLIAVYLCHISFYVHAGARM